MFLIVGALIFRHLEIAANQRRVILGRFLREAGAMLALPPFAAVAGQFGDGALLAFLSHGLASPSTVFRIVNHLSPARRG
jgi:hypothetical protein